MTTTGDPLLPPGDGHTPLGDGDRQGLKLSYITTRDEPSEAEPENLLRARQRRRPPRLEALLDDKYLRDLHRAMFGDVWAWAGSYRPLETSIGIDPARIAVGVRELVADARIWPEHEEPQDTPSGSTTTPCGSTRSGTATEGMAARLPTT